MDKRYQVKNYYSFKNCAAVLFISAFSCEDDAKFTDHLYNHNIPFLFCTETIKYKLYDTLITKQILRIFISQCIYTHVYIPFFDSQMSWNMMIDHDKQHYCIISRKIKLPHKILYYVILNNFLESYTNFFRNVMQNSSPKKKIHIVKDKRFYQCKINNPKLIQAYLKPTVFY